MKNIKNYLCGILLVISFCFGSIYGSSSSFMPPEYDWRIATDCEEALLAYNYLSGTQEGFSVVNLKEFVDNSQRAGISQERAMRLNKKLVATVNRSLRCFEQKDWKKNKQLYAQIIKLIEAGAQIDFKDESGQTALLSVVQSNNMLLAHLLVQYGASPDIANEKGNTPWIEALEQENDRMLDILLPNIQNVNACSRFENGLTLACRNQNLGLVEKLLAQRADVNQGVMVGSMIVKTPLNEAIESNDIALVKILLAHKAAINVQDNLGLTPLMMATVRNNKNIVKILLEQGADVTLQDRGGLTALAYAVLHISKPGDLDTIDLIFKALKPGKDLRDCYLLVKVLVDNPNFILRTSLPGSPFHSAIKKFIARIDAL